YRCQPHAYLARTLPRVGLYVVSAQRRHELVAVRDGRMYCLKHATNHLLADCGIAFKDGDIWKCSRIVALLSAARFRLSPQFDSMVAEANKYYRDISAAPDSLPLLFEIAFSDVSVDTMPSAQDAVLADVQFEVIPGIPICPRITAHCAVYFQRELTTGRLLPCRYVFELPLGS
ncbi:MAG: hypothetical protein ABIK86_05635, partial [candidate division WOR-3 bacterium]